MGAIDLYWLPLGAGGRFVRLNGRLFETVVAARERRRPQALFHSALRIEAAGATFVVEQTPAWGAHDSARGVVVEGPVGARWAGRWLLFRYEVRRWRDGTIPDLAEAVESPRRVSAEEDRAARLLELVEQLPTPTWGRDELHTGEMWNSNSVIAWLLARSGVDAERISPPAGGRAPGWRAGLVVAAR
ncbi:hypothetical protein Q5424_16705 [Conexibacter sp. JD483]|uniref:hypothetical protein n=1 Tax=unclassified Conexibacter TaxID=2627773 RepID=UPI0027282BD8|nr:MULTISPECIES: hypothetical protein [unclassified Conexibacter]MDO8188645.1 hypothetical protein [Conexibacter sp. CPCC 205706]MDO8201519.1 hypothetical protein [Conexibacter sp. CPCC 205762]MDR9370738.1 hypothetical protein [Conexibacter sp. JD483]